MLLVACSSTMAWGATAGERENELFQESRYVCVASFRSEKKAKAMSADLTVADYEVIVQSALVDGYDHYRVLIGPVPADKEFQKEFMQWLGTMGYKGSWVVKLVSDESSKLSPGFAEKPGAVGQTKEQSQLTPTEVQPSERNDDDLARLPKKHSLRTKAYTEPADTVVDNENKSADVSFSGYAKSFAIAQDKINNPFFSTDTIFQSQNSARLMLERFGDRAVWQMHYEVSPVMISRRFGFDIPSFNIVGDSYRLTDIESSLSSDDAKTQIYQNLDRFNVQLMLEKGDLTIGRQAISFGSARIINPTDVFLPFDVQTFNTEYRTGVDAIRYQRTMGELGEFDIGIVLGDGADQETSGAFLQLRGNANGKDLNLVLIEYAEQTLVGAGLEMALWDFGFWLEAASVNGEEDFVRASLGLDYAFTEFTFAQIEYHYNGAGSKDPSDYIDLTGTQPYQRGGVFLFGEHYLIPSVSVQLSPLWVVNALGIINLSDDSAFYSLSAAFNVAENFYMDFGFYHFSGDDLDISPSGLPTLESEYGASPDIFYTSIRYYF